MSITEAWGPYCAEVVHESFLPEVRDAYRTALAADGVLFAEESMRHVWLQWDAHAAARRNDIILNPDGSRVDMTGFDFADAKRTLQLHRRELMNEERLKSLADLGLLAAGGACATNEVINDRRLAEEASRRMLAQSMFKRFVQINIATEEWGAPWYRLVEDSFGGEGMDVPLKSAQHAAFAIAVLHSSSFNRLQYHFPLLPRYYCNVRRAIDRMPSFQQLHDGQSTAVAHASVLYRHSPEASVALIQELARTGKVTAAVDWHSELPLLTDREARIFDTARRT